MLGINLQCQLFKNTEEVSLIFSCDELVNYAVRDEISLTILSQYVSQLISIYDLKNRWIYC